MELNLYTIIYLFFRLSPFIIVCFFSLQSVFNNDLKGIIYLAGLIFACMLTVLVGAFPGFQLLTEEYGEKMPANIKQVCRLIELSNGVPISYLPLGQTVLAYTFIYLIYVIVKYNLIIQNIATLILFPVLIIGDIIWNIANGCSSGSLLFLSLVLGGSVGALWAYIIDSTGKVDLQLFNGISSASICSRPSKQVYRCRLPSNSTTPAPQAILNAQDEAAIVTNTQQILTLQNQVNQLMASSTSGQTSSSTSG